MVDVATQPGDAERYHVNFGIGLTSANVGVSGPIVKGRTSFNIALRRTWFRRDYDTGTSYRQRRL